MKDCHHNTKLSVYLAAVCDLWSVIVRVIVLCQKVYKVYSEDNVRCFLKCLHDVL